MLGDAELDARVRMPGLREAGIEVDVDALAGALQEGSSAKVFVPRDLGQLVSAINKVKKGDRLYVKLFRITPGAVIGTNELPNLPPSMVATLNSDRTSGGYTPMALSPIYEMELPPAEFVISGQQLIGIDVVR